MSEEKLPKVIEALEELIGDVPPGVIDQLREATRISGADIDLSINGDVSGTVYAAGQIISIAVTQLGMPEDIANEIRRRLNIWQADLEAQAAIPDSKAGENYVQRRMQTSILEALLNREKVGVRGLRGMGGLGKTELAIAVAAEARDSESLPGGVLWIDLGGRFLEDALADMERALGLPTDPKVSPDGRARLVKDRLSARPALVVLDDVRETHIERIKLLLPPSGCPLLVTTRLRDIPGLPAGAMKDLGLFTKTEARKLLRGIIGAKACKTEPEALDEVARLCGYHALALDVSARLIEKRLEVEEKPIAAHADRLRDTQKRLEALKFKYADQVGLSVEASLRASYETLTGTDPRRFDLLGVFAPASFSREAVSAVWETEPDETLVALERFRQFSMIGVERTRWALHDLWHSFAARRLAEREGEHEAAQARHLEHYLSEIHRHDDAGTYPQMLPDLPQLLHAFTWAESQQALPLMLELLGNSANLLRQFGYVRERFHWAEACVKLAQQRNDPQALGRALGSRGSAYSALATVQGEDRRARLLQALADYDAALALRRDVPLDYAATLNNRATVYSDLASVQGEDRRARLLQALADHDEALELQRDVPLDYATTLNNRANVYRALATMQGEDRQARLLQALADHDEALALRRDVPLDYAQTLNNRANVYWDLATVQGEDRRARLLQALADYDEALDLRCDVPLDYAQTLNNRANVYSDLATVQGEDRRARLLQALADYDAALDLQRDVPRDYAGTLNNRALVYSDLATVQGEDRRARLLQALADHDEALDLRRDVPLDYAATLNNRALVYSDLASVQGEDRRARLLQALADYDAALELQRDVPLDYATTLNNRANVYWDLATVQGEDRQARLLQALADHDEALDLRRDVPLDYATTLNNRAVVYSDLASVQGEDRRARLLQALADYDAALGLQRDVPLAKAMTQGNLGNLYNDLEDYPKALRAMWEAARGFEHVGHDPYISQIHQIMRNFKRERGKTFDELWEQVVGGQQPEWLTREE